jgi:hypothetical protein
MKNKLLKFYIATFYLCSTVMLFAQPGTEDTDGAGNLEGTSGDTTPAPIDDYIWILAIVGLIFVFMKFRAIQSKRVNS